MIKYNHKTKEFKRLGISISLLLFCIIALYSCFKLKSIDHPTTAETYSYFDVTFVGEPTGDDNADGRGLFGALLPKGWRVADYTDYTVYNKDGSVQSKGRFSFDQYYVDFVESNYETPEGYYWWGGRSIDDMNLFNTKEFVFVFRIYTDNQTGDFKLRYTMGTNADGGNIKDHVQTDYYTIKVEKGNEFPMKKELNWEFLPNKGWDEKIQFYSDKDYDGFFTRWYGWNGGDIGISTPLGDGRSIWVWGDSHTGRVVSDRVRESDESQFERNFIIEQDGEDFSAFRLLNEGSPDGKPNGKIKESVIPTDDAGNLLDKHAVWYWPNGSSIYYRDGVPELHMVLSRMEKAGEGMWGMRGAATDVAVFSLPDVKLQRIDKFKHKFVSIDVEGRSYDLGYAGQVFKDDDGTVYIYGNGRIDHFCGTGTYVARVVDGDLTKDWEFYDAKTKKWSKEASWQKDGNVDIWRDAAVAHVPLFVFKDGDKYFAFELPPCFGTEIFIHEAETPYGPFKNRKQVGQLPDEITNGFICTLPGVHQQYSKNGELFFSISKNYDNEARKNDGLEELEAYNVPGSADNYLPYFFRVKNWRDKLNISERDVTDNKGTLTAQYEDNIGNLTDNDENTTYAANSATAWIEYESPSPVNLRRYTITSTEDAPERDPLHWKVYGSNDGNTWTVLDERYHAEFEERHQTVNYVVPIDAEFTNFKLEVLATKGGQGLQISEWQLFGKYDYEVGTLAELDEVIVNGESIPVEDIMNVNVLPTQDGEITVEFKTKDYGRISGISNPLKITINNPEIQKYSFKVISEDSETEKDYELHFNRWFAFDDIIKVKWNNTLMLNLNKLADYTITDYQWYKDNTAISGATGKSYSAGPKKTDLLDQQSAYHIKMTTPEGDLRSATGQVTLKSMTMQAYPNPVKIGELLTLYADVDEELLTDATVDIFNSQGGKIRTVKIQNQTTTLDAPLGAGVYIVKLSTSKGFEDTVKVIVK